jgi:hypothetical protein
LDDVAADYEMVAEALARIEQTQRVIAKRQPSAFGIDPFTPFQTLP